MTTSIPAAEKNPLLELYAMRPVPAPPRRTLRRQALEARLDELVAAQPVVWMRAPSCSGKRTAVAAWVRRSRVRRRTSWLVRAEAVSAPDAAPRSLEHTLAASRLAAEADRREASGAPRLFVLDAGPSRVTADDVEALRRLARHHPRVRIVVISDTDHPVLDQGRADIELDELGIPDDALRSEFAEHGVVLTEPALRMLEAHSGDAALSGAFLAARLENPALSMRETLTIAHARAIALFVTRVAAAHAADILMLLTLLPAMPERALAAYDPLPEAFVSLAQRGLIVRAGEDGPASYALPQELREVMRSLFVAHYLAHRERLHRLAADVAHDSGQFEQAVAQLLAVPDARAAVAVFREHWSDAPLDVPRAAAMLERLPQTELLADIEAAAAAWLVRLGAEGRAPRGPVELAVTRAAPSEIGTLQPTGRLSVLTAQIMALLDRRETERAGAIGAQAMRELEEAPLPPSDRAGHVYSTFLLAVARAAVYRGAIAESHGLYAEVLALPAAAEGSINTYRAHVGQAFAFTVDGELAAAQRALDAAAAVVAGHAALHGRLDRLQLWCQAMIWSIGSQDDKLDVLLESLRESSRGHDDSREWQRMLAGLRAHALLRQGFAVEAVALARHAVDSVEAPRDHPLIRQWTTSVLGLALAASGQPGAALTLASDIPSNVDHAPCFHATRAFAHVAAGDPRAALQATEECVSMQDRHARLPLVEVFLARAFAFEALGLPDAAEDIYLSALGLADELGVRVALDAASNRTIAELHRRSAERAPLLVTGALRADVRNVGQPRLKVLPQLSDRERRILQYLMTPLPVAQIAEALYLSPNTVKTHLRNVYRKLDVQSRKQAADVAVGWGLEAAPLPPLPDPLSPEARRAAPPR